MVSLPVAVPKVRSTQVSVMFVGLILANVQVGVLAVPGILSVNAVPTGEAAGLLPNALYAVTRY